MSFEAVGWALEQPVGGAKKIILIGIASHADRYGLNAWPSLDTLAGYACVDPRSVRRAISELEEAGYVTRVVKGGGTRFTPDSVRPNLYHLNMQPQAALVDQPSGDEVVGGEDASVRGERTPVSGGRGRQCPGGEDASVRGERTPTSSPERTPTSSEPPIEPSLINTPQPPKGGAGGFDEFFSAYPRQQGEARARRQWVQLAPDAALERAILAAVTAQRESPDWQRDGGRYIPMPSKWLRDKRWLDGAAKAAPGPKGRDPVIEKLERDDRRAVKPPPEVREKIDALLGRRTRKCHAA